MKWFVFVLLGLAVFKVVAQSSLKIVSIEVAGQPAEFADLENNENPFSRIATLG